MIPQSNIQEWRSKTSWKTANQVEQDLVISRALVELFAQREFRDDLAAKVKDPDFLADTVDLLRPSLDYSHQEAHRFVDEHLVSLL